jgi:hypothetical protein
MVASTSRGINNTPGSLQQGRRMSDEARPRAGSSGASWFGPAGEAARIRKLRPAFAGAAGDLVVTRFVAGTQITGREPRSSFQGVMLKAPAAGLRRGYAIVLAAVSGAEDVALELDLGEDEVVARWRGAAAKLGLPMMLCHADGEIELLQRQLGGVTLGRDALRRRRVVRRRRRRQ